MSTSQKAKSHGKAGGIHPDPCVAAFGSHSRIGTSPRPDSNTHGVARRCAVTVTIGCRKPTKFERTAQRLATSCSTRNFDTLEPWTRVVCCSIATHRRDRRQPAPAVWALGLSSSADVADALSTHAHARTPKKWNARYSILNISDESSRHDMSRLSRGESQGSGRLCGIPNITFLQPHFLCAVED